MRINVFDIIIRYYHRWLFFDGLFISINLFSRVTDLFRVSSQPKMQYVVLRAASFDMVMLGS